MQLCVLPITISKIQGFLRGALRGEEGKFHTKKTKIRRFTKVFLYEEKIECFARRKRRFEGSQRFFSSCRFMGLRVLFKNISPSCGGRFMRRRRNVSHEENEEAKVYKGFLYK